jgi:hypothetical protein
LGLRGAATAEGATAGDAWVDGALADDASRGVAEFTSRLEDSALITRAATTTPAVDQRWVASSEPSKVSVRVKLVRVARGIASWRSMRN